MTADVLLADASPTPYQLLPPLGADIYAALRADIAESGIAQPIEVDENGAILDGHHRAWIAAELGVDCPRRVVTGLTEQEKRNYARRVNALRRSMTADQRREQVAQMRSEGQSLRQIGATLGVPKSTVADDVSQLSESGQLTEPEKITGTSGRPYPAKKARHECQECGEAFTHPVWHCARCGNHWDDGQNCNTCADTTVSVDTTSGEIVSPPAPTTTTKPPAEPRQPKTNRKSLPDAFFTAVGDLTKNVERIGRLTADDRFPRNADQVAAKHRSDLIRATEALARVLDLLT